MHELFFLFQFLYLMLIHFFRELQQTDVHILKFINHERITSLDSFFIFITNVATVTTYSFAILLLIYSYIKRSFLLERKGWLLLIALTLNSAIADTIKNFVQRPRPFITYSFIHNLVDIHSSSFPSGHTAEVFSLAFGLAILFPKSRWGLVLAWLWAFLVAYSRLVLGVHYPSDVVASIFISGIFAFTFIKLMVSLDFIKENKGALILR